LAVEPGAPARALNHKSAPARALMIQGTGSDVGKSLLVAGLCRAYWRRGLAVRPFKPQNMSNNAAVTADGGEIGRAQALQARAAGVEPTVDMNPVLLKPASGVGAQVVVQGQVAATATARDYHKLKPTLLPQVLDSFARLASGADLVLVEGAGSPAEVNLRAGDIANMGFAEAAGVPVVIVGDIERGGVIASLVGTHALLSESERALTKGYIVNRFRGDVSLFDDALGLITARTGWRAVGVVPFFADARLLPKEDALALDRVAPDEAKPGAIRIAVPCLARIANFDDLDPLAAENDVEVVMVRSGEALPGDADLILLPGSKAVLSDLAMLRAEGWDIDIQAHLRRGGRLVGLCGGYQMLGRMLRDPDGVEGPAGEAAGLGLLNVETVLSEGKTVTQVQGMTIEARAPIAGYEIHLGRTDGPDCARAWFELSDGRRDGAVSADGLVRGSYLHGLFAADDFRQAFLGELRAGRRAGSSYEARIDAVLDDLARHLEAHLDLDALYGLSSGA